MSNHRKKLLFFLPNNIMKGSGGERCLYYYLKFLPVDIFEAIVIQTDYADFPRLKLDELDPIKSIKFVTLHDYFNKFSFMADSVLMSAILSFLINPILSFIFKRKYRRILKFADFADIIYLFVNDNFRLFKNSEARIIGSNHGSFKKPIGIFKKIQILLVRTKLIQKRIDGYHIFPGTFPDNELLGRPFDFVLPPLGIDTSTFVPSESSSQKIRFLYVGRLENFKGIPFLIQLWKRIGDNKTFEFVIVGNGSLLSLVKNCGFENVILHEDVSINELATIYANSDVFLFPTKSEAYPQVIMEALSSGLYVMTSDVIKGTFDNFEKIGHLLYLPENIESYCKEIFKITRKIDKIRLRKWEIHDIVKQEYDIKNTIKRFYEVLTSMIS